MEYGFGSSMCLKRIIGFYDGDSGVMFCLFELRTYLDAFWSLVTCSFLHQKAFSKRL